VESDPQDAELSKLKMKALCGLIVLCGGMVEQAISYGQQVHGAFQLKEMGTCFPFATSSAFFNDLMGLGWISGSFSSSMHVHPSRLVNHSGIGVRYYSI
jgi:hypothetical protein